MTTQKYLKNLTGLGLFFVLSCNSPKNETTENPEINTENSITLSDDQLKNVQLVLGKAEQKSITSLLKMNGKIDVPPQNMVSISCPMGGYLKRTKLLPGMHIRKGEVLASLEDAQYIQLQQDFLITKVKLTLAITEYERQKTLNASQAASDKVLQQAKAELETLAITEKALAQKLLLLGINPEKLSENNLSKSVSIFSPIDGFVSKVNVNIGKYVSPTDVLFELVNPTDIHLNLQVFEKDLPKLAIGQKVICYTPNNPAKKYQATIILISKDVDENRIVEVHCHFEQYDKNLIPNMYMNAEIAINAVNAMALPEEAVLNFEGKNYIFSQQNKHTFDFVEVQTGEKQNGFIEIKSTNIDFSKQPIVLKNAYSLLMKLKNTEE